MDTPNYYTSSDGTLTAQQVIDAFNLNWNRGNVLKYIIRAGRKSDNPLGDLKKARDYIDFEIAKLSSADLHGLASREALWILYDVNVHF